MSLGCKSPRLWSFTGPWSEALTFQKVKVRIQDPSHPSSGEQRIFSLLSGGGGGGRCLSFSYVQMEEIPSLLSSLWSELTTQRRISMGPHSTACALGPDTAHFLWLLTWFSGSGTLFSDPSASCCCSPHIHKLQKWWQVGFHSSPHTSPPNALRGTSCLVNSEPWEGSLSLIVARPMGENRPPTLI